MPTQKPSPLEKGNVNELVAITLATLAANTGLIGAALAMTRGGKILSSTISGGLEGHTEGEGPVMWGIMSSALTLAELEEWIELGGPLTPTENISVERATRGRLINVLGVMGPGVSQCQIFKKNESMRGLAFPEASEVATGWSWWVYNQGAQLTTGSFLRLAAQHFVEWNRSG